jgi:isochorismate hydrolase
MSSDLIFGPLGQEWHYSKSMKMYDLCNGAIEKITFATTEGPPETYVTITPEATVLVIVDMQNFFLDSKCVDHQNGLKAVGPTIKTIERCRELGIQVEASFHAKEHTLTACRLSGSIGA